MSSAAGMEVTYSSSCTAPLEVSNATIPSGVSLFPWLRLQASCFGRGYNPILRAQERSADAGMWGMRARAGAVMISIRCRYILLA